MVIGLLHLSILSISSLYFTPRWRLNLSPSFHQLVLGCKNQHIFQQDLLRCVKLLWLYMGGNILAWFGWLCAACRSLPPSPSHIHRNQRWVTIIAPSRVHRDAHAHDNKKKKKTCSTLTHTQRHTSTILQCANTYKARKKSWKELQHWWSSQSAGCL